MNSLLSPNKPLNRRGAFTLTEILVVIAIIAVLAAFVFPAVGQMRGRAVTIQCVSNLRSIGQALERYVSDHNGDYPRATWSEGGAPSALYTGAGPNGLGLLVVAGYFGEAVDPPRGSSRPKVLLCPSEMGRAFFADDNWSSYAYQSPFPAASGAARTDIPQRSTQVPGGWALAMDVCQAYAGFPAPHHGEKLNVLYADGHVETRSFLGSQDTPAWGVWPGKFDLTEPRQ